MKEGNNMKKEIKWVYSCSEQVGAFWYDDYISENYKMCQKLNKL